MRIEFSVQGVPPKKHGEKSMWARGDEAPRVALLRQEALRARSEAGVTGCLSSFLSVELTLLVPAKDLEKVGDLDSFVAGVCDGLQAAHPNAHAFHSVFDSREHMDPKRPLLIEDDARVLSIRATKTLVNEGEEISYRVAVEEIGV